MEKNILNKNTFLLPKYFKILGIAVAILSFGTALYLAKMYPDWLPSQKHMARNFTLDGLIVGLLFIAWSKDKVEDERTIALRLKTAAWTFMFGVIFVLVRPVMAVLHEDILENQPAQTMLMMMLIMFICMYYMRKRVL